MPRRSITLLRQICVPDSPLSRVVDLLAAKRIHTAQQLAEKLNTQNKNIVGFFEGHVYHANNPNHVLTVTAQEIAKLLFPDNPCPADKLARIIKGLETCDIVPAKDTSPPSDPGTSNGKYEGLRMGSGVTIGYKPAPGRPYLVRHSDGKWELLKAPKNP